MVKPYRRPVYWDSCVFIYLLDKKSSHHTILDHLINEANEGRLLIVTSIFTKVEVCKYKDGSNHGQYLTPEQAELLAEFFRAEFLVIKGLTDEIADLARNLVSELHIKPPDAVHLATAAVDHLPLFCTYDADLLGHDGWRNMKIEIPSISQHRLPLETDSPASPDEE